MIAPYIAEQLEYVHFRGRDMFPCLKERDASDFLVIAIDGPSASGKGTIACRLAARMGYAMLDTGALYRAVGRELFIMKGNPDDSREATLAAHRVAAHFSLEILQDPILRCEAIGLVASKIAAYGTVREALLGLQRGFALCPPPLADGTPANGVVLDGRDIGTVVCPKADVKLYITADPVQRAKRREKELQLSGKPVTYEAVFSTMRERDTRDWSRTLAPMRMAQDAFVIDTTHLDVRESLEQALAVVRGALICKACYA